MKVRLAMFLNKKVDVVITSRDNKRGKGFNIFHTHHDKTRSDKKCLEWLLQLIVVDYHLSSVLQQSGI